jgi:hypothetical protein
MKRLLQTSHRSFCYRALLPFLTITVIFAMFATPAHSVDVSLQWNSVAEADGYNVYYGTESGSYQTPEDVMDQTSHTLSLDPGTYYFAVTAYNNYGESGYSEEVPATIADSNPPTSVSLTSDLASPQPEGTTMTFTADASGGTGSYEYRFWLRDTQGQWSTVQDYSASANFIWNVTAGIDRISVWAKNAGSNDYDVVWNLMPFSTDTNPPTSVSLTSDLASPQPEGTPVTFTAQATGGSDNYEYKFWFQNATGQWSVAQDYSSTSSFEWNADSNILRILVWARNAGSNDIVQVKDFTWFSTDTNPPASVSLTSNLPSPQPAGTPVTFTAQATGGSGNYEYKFWFQNATGQWSVAQDYSSSPSFEWNTEADILRILVWARNTGSNNIYQVNESMWFSTDANPPASVSLTPNLPSPQPAGTPVTFTAQATGGSGNYEYQFWTKNTDGTVTMVQDYSTLAGYLWIATADVYRIKVLVRNTGTHYKYQVYSSIPFTTE